MQVGVQLAGRGPSSSIPRGGVWDEWYLALDDGRWGWLAEAQGRFYLGTFTQTPDGALALGGDSLPGGRPPGDIGRMVSGTVGEVSAATFHSGRGRDPLGRGNRAPPNHTRIFGKERRFRYPGLRARTPPLLPGP